MPFAVSGASRLTRNLISVAVSLLILILLFCRIDLRETLAAIGSANALLLCCAGVASLVANLLLSPAQWRSVLNALRCPITYLDSIFVKLAVYPAKGALPLKSGELLKVAYLRVRYGLPVVVSIGAISFVLALNLLIALLIAMVGSVWALHRLPGSEQAQLVGRLMPYLLAMIGVLLTLGLLFVTSTAGRRPLLTLSKQINSKLYVQLCRQLSAYEALGLKRCVLPFLYGSVSILLELLVFCIVFRAIRIPVPIWAAVAFVPLTMIAGNLPFTIYGLGIRESAIVFFFRAFAREGQEAELLAGGILFSAIDYLLFVLLGIPFLKHLIERTMAGKQP